MSPTPRPRPDTQASPRPNIRPAGPAAARPRRLSLQTALVAALLILPGLPSPAQAADARGALLYDTHCIGCHTAQAHWRDRRLVTDWTSLREQVRRWQDLQRLNWSEDDITLVARHLNSRFYRVPERGDRGPAAGVGPAQPPAARATVSATCPASSACSAGGRS
jgi:hypothetical protein